MNKSAIAAAIPATIGILGSVFLSDQSSTTATISNIAVEDQLRNATELTDEELTSIATHAPFGLPDHDNLLIRPGYISSYNPQGLIPQWTAYHISPDYLGTPKRQKDFSKFRIDPQLSNPVRTSDYTNSGFSRGHLAPYAIMGGDRDGDGYTAADQDQDEYPTIFTANYMSNMAPQRQYFNGESGLWYNLERWVQEELVKEFGNEAWIIAGSVFVTDPGRTDVIGKRVSIHVPDMFYKIVTVKIGEEVLPLAFLFPHLESKRDDLTRYLVPVSYLEALTGLTFFDHIEGPSIDKHQNTTINLEKISLVTSTRILEGH
jgi:endonuclease G